MEQLYFKNSKLFDEPWKHQIIEDFLPEFQIIKKSSRILQDKYSSKIISSKECLSLFQVYNDIGKEAFDIICNANTLLLKNLKEIVKPFPNARKFDEYISIPSFHILPAYTPWQKIHDEAEDKTVSIVVYLYPEKSTGTTLYEKNDRNSFQKEIEWKENTAMLFCGEKNVTWHDFRSVEFPRVTLNFFLRTPKNDKLNITKENYEITFGNGLVTYIPTNLPKNILDAWNEGKFKQKISW